MGVDGDVTITNLKSATGIADDRLSAHHPNGTGNQTALGDFLIDQIGRRDTVNGYQTDLERIGVGPLEQGDVFEVRVDVERAAGAGVGGGQHFVEQVLKGGNNFSFDDGNDGVQFNSIREISGTPSAYDSVAIEYKVTGFSSVSVRTKLTGSLNNDATNHNTTLEYLSANDSNTTVRDASPAMDCLTWNTGFGTTNEIRLAVDLYDPKDQITDYINWDLEAENAPPLKNENVDGQDIAEFVWNHGGTLGNSLTVRVDLRNGQGGTIIQSESNVIDTSQQTGTVNYTQFNCST